MCGICGFINLKESARPSEAILKRMMDALIPRGPDDAGVYIDDIAALGHRRLSIIDLVTGHQPISSEDGSKVIIYNGEVYNFHKLKEKLLESGHRFKTHSDTEVVLHAYEEYGDKFPSYLNGMFALAIWDCRKKKLFIARDRFGKKPLYYGTFADKFIFGSELKSILRHPEVRRQIDLGALQRYLAYEYVPSPQTIFKGINKLEAGSWLALDGSKIHQGRYWDALPPLAEKSSSGLSVKEIECRMTGLLKESVRKRLISDVPLGVFLSGGIDSSSVVAMMAELVPPKDIKTFSIGFKEKSYDESSDARLVAEHFGTDHREEILDPKTMLDAFPAVLELLDEPFADSSIIPTYLISKFTRRHVKVALGGDGGDELFLGYPSFIAHKIMEMSAFIPDSVRKAAFNMLTAVLPVSNEYMSANFRARRFLRGLDFPEEVRHQVWIGSFTPPEQKKLFLPGVMRDEDITAFYLPTSSSNARAGGLNSMDRAIYTYINTYLTDDILFKVDRASMANSLEVRAPFLDSEFAEFVLGIMPSLKLKGFSAKWILKQALKDMLPPETLGKRKQGFAVPVAQWLKGDLRGLLEKAFDKKKIESEGIFDYNHVNGIVRSFVSDKCDTRKEIWALFMFEMWYDKWMR